LAATVARCGELWFNEKSHKFNRRSEVWQRVALRTYAKNLPLKLLLFGFDRNFSLRTS
jgi:hypothetical protein